ncbi:hypothetical protein D3C81_1414270 [compost metagenome]
MVEIVASAVDRQVPSPPVRVALKGDAATIIDTSDTVRPATQRCFEATAVGKVTVFPPVLGQHRQSGQVQWQGAVEVVLEVKANLPGGLDLDSFDIGKLGAVLKVALAHQQLEGVAHIFGTNGVAIGKTCAGVEVKTQPTSLRIAFKLASDKSINGVGLVLGTYGQRGIQPAIDLRHTDALVDIGQYMVELADLEGRAAQAAAFGGVGVGVFEVLERSGVARGFAIDGEGVSGCGAQARTREQQADQQQAR